MVLAQVKVHKYSEKKLEKIFGFEIYRFYLKTNKLGDINLIVEEWVTANTGKG